MHKKNIFWLLSIYMLTCTPVSAQVLFEKDCQTEIFVGKEEKEVVHTAMEILQKDVKNVFDARLVPASAPGHDIEIVAGTVDNPEMQAYLKRNEVDLPPIMGQWEAFQIRKLGKKQVLVTGSDARGLAYGLLEISRMIGVSPWEWWADVIPDKRDRFLVSEIKEGQQAPSVQFRGIFLNDEDWGLTPWSTKNFEPVCLVPTHAVEGSKLRFAVSTDDREPQVFDCETAEYSEEWKANILRAQAVKTTRSPSGGRKGRIKITALDEGVIIDQIRLR